MNAITILVLIGPLLIGLPFTPNGKQEIQNTVAQNPAKVAAPLDEGTPFGLRMGMTLAQMGGNPKNVAPGFYTLTSVPEPHSAFESYSIQVGPQTGLCWVKGIGRTLTTSVYGIELKHEFESMKKSLREIYGEPKVFDLLLPRSIWNEPRDWMMSVVKKERILAATWDEKSKASLPMNIKYVALGVSALNTNRGYIVLEFAFTNESKCEAEIREQQNRSLM